MIGTVVEPITLHYTGKPGNTATIEPGTLVDVLGHEHGLYRIRCAQTPWAGSLVDEEHVRPDTTTAGAVSLFVDPDERTAP